MPRVLPCHVIVTLLSHALSLSLPPSFDCRATRAWKPRHRSFAGLSLARTFTHVLLHGPGRGRPERSRIQNSCRRNLAVSDLVRFWGFEGEGLRVRRVGMASDSWTKEFQEAARLADDIEGRIAEKNGLAPHSSEGTRIVSATRRKLTMLNTKLDRLESLLQSGPLKATMYVNLIPFVVVFRNWVRGLLDYWHIHSYGGFVPFLPILGLCEELACLGTWVIYF